jgi:hypothetical protein
MIHVKRTFNYGIPFNYRKGNQVASCFRPFSAILILTEDQWQEQANGAPTFCRLTV